MKDRIRQSCSPVLEFFPHWCRKAIRKEVRAKLFRSIVNTTVIDIHKAGFYPSQWRVREALPKFVDMREPVANDEWKRTLFELGFSY